MNEGLSEIIGLFPVPSPRDKRERNDDPGQKRRGHRYSAHPPNHTIPVDYRDRRSVNHLDHSQLRVRDYRTSGEHRILNVTGKGGKERITPLHLEAVELLAAWLAVPGIGGNPAGPLFPAAGSPRGMGRDGFRREPMITRAVEKLIGRYVEALDLDPAVTVHSLRVTALTTARERGSDIIDLQEFAGHADTRTTLTYIRSRDRLSKSPAYVLSYK
jgi:integrase/recombinase XerD